MSAHYVSPHDTRALAINNYGHFTSFQVRGKHVRGLDLHMDRLRAAQALVLMCRAHNVPLIDCQQQTEHLARLGAHAISRADFLDTIKQAQQQPVTRWQFDHTLWDALLR